MDVALTQTLAYPGRVDEEHHYQQVDEGCFLNKTETEIIKISRCIYLQDDLLYSLIICNQQTIIISITQRCYITRKRKRKRKTCKGMGMGIYNICNANVQEIYEQYPTPGIVR